MKRFTFKVGNDDKNINIPVTGNGNLLGYDDDLDALVTNETENSINDVFDGEVKRFLPETTYTIKFKFATSPVPPGSPFIYSVAPLEFNTSTGYTTTAAKNSFYVVQLFNTYKDELSTKGHTGYFNGFDFAKNSLSSIYSYDATMEFSNLYLSASFLTGLTSTTLYAKFLFYSAKSGKYYVFKNDNPTLTGGTQSDLYQPFTLDQSSMSYSFPESNILLIELVNSGYTAFVNNTAESFSVEVPSYPIGNIFTNSGEYITN